MPGDRCLVFRLNFVRREHNPYATTVDESCYRESFGHVHRALTTIFVGRFSAGERTPGVCRLTIRRLRLHRSPSPAHPGDPVSMRGCHIKVADRIASAPGFDGGSSTWQMRAEPWTGSSSRTPGWSGECFGQSMATLHQRKPPPTPLTGWPRRSCGTCQRYKADWCTEPNVEEGP